MDKRRFFWSVRFGAVVLAAIATTGCAHKGKADQGPDRMEQMRKGVADAARSPFRDVGLIKPDVPSSLTGLDYPYVVGNLTQGCPQVLYELGRLDAVLGEETYQPGAHKSLTEKGMDEMSGAAIGAMQDATNVVPFRSWVRRASGAKKAERNYAYALDMGQARRAFLRGYGAALNCPNVLPVPPQEPARTPPPQPAPAPEAPQILGAPAPQVAQGAQ